jgi:hypothetical protein
MIWSPLRERGEVRSVREDENSVEAALTSALERSAAQFREEPP